LKPDYYTARLLSGKDRLSVVEKEAILERIIDQTKAEKKSEPASWMSVRRLSYTAAAAVVLFAVPLLIYLALTPVPDEFISRGISGSPSGFTVACLGAGDDGFCHPGDKLFFKVNAPEGKPFFSAFARRTDGTVIWYFPGEEFSHSIEVSKNNYEGVLSVGVLLGSEHRPGYYVVFGLFSSRRLSKSQIREAVEEYGTVSGDIVLKRQSFSVGSE